MARGSALIGVALIIGGAIVSLTVVGAAIGIPMILLGLIIWLLGAVVGGASGTARSAPGGRREEYRDPEMDSRRQSENEIDWEEMGRKMDEAYGGNQSTEDTPAENAREKEIRELRERLEKLEREED